MKLTLQQITSGSDEVIVRYRELNEEIEEIIRRIKQHSDRIYAACDGQAVILRPDDILYLESVDERVWAYTAKVTASVPLTLAAAERMYADCGFFRCSKSMVINIFHIEYLRSIPGGRVDVTMDNGEHVVISRRYVKALRSVLKGESQ